MKDSDFKTQNQMGARFSGCLCIGCGLFREPVLPAATAEYGTNERERHTNRCNQNDARAQACKRCLELYIAVHESLFGGNSCLRVRE
jgi:hypothetical protein